MDSNERESTQPRPCILVVDDDASVVELIQDALASYCVQGVTQAETALERVRDESIALLIVDLHLPNIDGAELVRRVHDDPSTHNLPIILMSSYDDLRLTAARLGVSATLPKPFRLANFERAVTHLLGRRTNVAPEWDRPLR